MSTQNKPSATGGHGTGGAGAGMEGGEDVETSEIMKRSIGSDEEGKRAYVSYAAYGYPREVEIRLREEADRFWDKVKEIIESSAGENPTE